jgi:hypothetical protein
VVDVVDGVVTLPVPAAWPPSVVVSGVVVPPVLLMADWPPPVTSLVLSVETVLSVDVVSVFVVLDLAAAGGVGEPVVGTTSAGAPALLSDPGPLLPHAASTKAAAKAAKVASDVRKRRLLMNCDNLPPGGSADRLRRNWIQALPAPRAVDQILLRELVTVVAEPEVLDSPRQLGLSGRKRQKLGDDFESFAGLLVKVDRVRVGLNDDLTTGGGGPHAVFLEEPHVSTDSVVVMVLGQGRHIPSDVTNPDPDRNDEDDETKQRPNPPDRGADDEQRRANRDRERDDRPTGEMDLLADRRNRLGLRVDVLNRLWVGGAHE